jgi:hypothetical protein
MRIVVADTGRSRAGRRADKDEAEAGAQLIGQTMGRAVGHAAKVDCHCERSEAIHRAARTKWIASSLSLLAMTAFGVDPEIILL